MRVNETPTSSETPFSTELPPPPPPPKKFGKKVYLVIGLIAVAAVVSALLLVFFLPGDHSPKSPGGTGSTIPLSLNYNPGEKMTYDMRISMSYMGYTYNITGTACMDILGFDGENYTIEETVETQSPYPSESSYTIKMDKMGRIVDFAGLPPELQQMFSSFASIPGFGSYFPMEQAKVGDSWQIPMNIATSDFSINGIVNYTLSEIKNVNVPAGAYQVFRIDLTANNVRAIIQSYGITMTLYISMSGQMYLEYGTCRLIDFNVQETISGTYMGQSISMNMDMQMQLTEHIKP